LQLTARFGLAAFIVVLHRTSFLQEAANHVARVLQPGKRDSMQEKLFALPYRNN